MLFLLLIEDTWGVYPECSWDTDGTVSGRLIEFKLL